MDFGEYKVDNILIVDDKKSDVDDLISDFRKNNCIVNFAESEEDATELVKKLQKLDLVIIDLCLEGDYSCTGARKLLIEIKDRFFVPVIVYTAHPHMFEGKLRDIFPSNMIIPMGKSYGFDDVRMATWLKTSPTTRISMKWSETVIASVVKALWQIEDLDKAGIPCILQAIRRHESDLGVLGEREFIDLLNKVLVRAIKKDDSLVEKVKSIISGLEDETSISEEQQEQFRKFWRIMAYDGTSRDKLPFNSGDVISFSKDDYRIIVTPACDMSRAGPEVTFKIVRGYEEKDLLKKHPDLKNRDRLLEILKNNKYKYHALLFASPSSENLIFDFSLVESFTKKHLEKMHSKGKIKIILTVDSPFYEYMIQRYASYHRLGTPQPPKEIYSSIIEKASI